MLPFTRIEGVRPYVKLSSVGQQNILVYKLLVSSDENFLCQSDTCGSVPRDHSAKRDRTNPYQSPVSNGKRDTVPRVYLHLFGGGR